MCISVSKSILRKLQKKEDRFNKVYNSDGEPGPWCDMKDLENTQDFYEYALPDVFTPDVGKFSMVMKAMNLFWEKGTNKIIKLVT